MFNFDSETWIYIAIIAVAYFFYRSTRGRSSRKNRRRAGFRERYNVRRKETREIRDETNPPTPKDSPQAPEGGAKR